MIRVSNPNLVAPFPFSNLQLNKKSTTMEVKDNDWSIKEIKAPKKGVKELDHLRRLGAHSTTSLPLCSSVTPFILSIMLLGRTEKQNTWID